MRVAKTIWGRITPVHAAVVGILFLSLSGIISFRTLPTTLQAEESGFSSVLFGIEDKGNSESIFFSFSEKTGTANQLGTNQSGADFEASDIHPTTGEWYAIKGKKGTCRNYTALTRQTDCFPLLQTFLYLKKKNLYQRHSVLMELFGRFRKKLAFIP